MRLLILTGIISLLMSCAITQPASKVEQTTAPSQAEKSHSMDLAQPGTENNGLRPEPRKSLSSEVLYYLLSADVAGQRGQYGLAAGLYGKAAEITRDPRIALQATRTAYYVRNDKLSIKAASLWHDIEPHNLEARQVLAALLVRSGQADAALEHFEYVLANSKQSERQGFMLITSLLSKEQDKKTALAVMKKLINKRQKNSNALYAYSQLAFLVGNLDEASVSIQKAINLETKLTEAYILQANIFNRQGYKAHALEVLRQTLDSQSDNAGLRMFYARKLIDAKQLDNAMKHFSRLVDDNASHHEARYAKGLLALQMNKPELASEQFAQLIENKARISESQYYLAQAYELQDMYDKAIIWYKKIKNHQYTFEAELRIATIQAKQGKLQLALERLKNISSDTLEKKLRVYLAEGEILNDAKKYAAALSLYSQALQELTDNTRLLYARALTAEKLDKIDLAVSDLENIVVREPTNAQALNALGYTLVDKTKQMDKGLEYIKKAIMISPDDAAILDSMGWAYYRLGQYNEALKYLKRAFEKLNDAEIAAHLGEVLWVAGEHGKAREIWNSALQQAPQHDLLLNVMQKFAE